MGMFGMYVRPDCQAAKDDRTVQTHKSTCDLNKIVAKAQKTGALSHVAKYSLQYGDATGPDYEAALNVIAEADSMFAELPSEVRNEFGNDAMAFLDFVDARSPAEVAEALPLLAAPGRQFPDVEGGRGAPTEGAEPPSSPSPAADPPAKPPEPAAEEVSSP